MWEVGVLVFCEFGFVLHGEDLGWEGLALFLDEGFGDESGFGYIGPRDDVFAEGGVLIHLVEDAVRASGCAADDEGAVGGCEHGVEDAVEDGFVFLEEGSLVGEDLVGSVAAEEVLAAGEGDDAAVVLEEELGALALLDGVLEDEGWEVLEECLELVHHDHALAEAGGDYEGGGLGMGDGVPDGAYGDGGGLAGLAAHAYEYASVRVAEEAGLVGVGVEVEELFSEPNGVASEFP